MIKEKLNQLGIDTKNKVSGQHKFICPNCSHTRKKKTDPCLSVNIDTGRYNCHNNCGFSGMVGDYKKIEKKEFKIPIINNTSLSDKTLSWFTDIRKISKSTLLRFKISESSEWMSQVEKEMNCINFNYFRNGELVNIKFRDAKKNFKLVSGAELIFYNLDSLIDADYAIICEGEIDCLTFHESGLFNVVSVPNGASKGNKLEYLDNCYEYLEKIDKIIIATDTDTAGISLRDELIRRIGKDKCWIMNYPEGCKDSNEVLVRYGIEGVNQCFDNITQYPLEGIDTVEDLEDNIHRIYEFGYPKGKKIGFHGLDEYISWRTGEFTTWTGIPGSGKSEFIDQVMIKLSMLHGWKWGVFSAENQPSELHFAKIAEKLIGKTFYTENENYKMSINELVQAKQFINEHFFFVKISDENLTLDGLLGKCSELVKRKGINGFLIDPWNYVEHKIPDGYTETRYISDALSRVSNLSKKLDIHIFLVAHPTKIQKDQNGKYKIATLYDISGSAHWFNKTDNGISVYRDFETGVVDVYVQKIRFKFIGKIGFSSFQWDKFTGRYTELFESKEKEIPF